MNLQIAAIIILFLFTLYQHYVNKIIDKELVDLEKQTDSLKEMIFKIELKLKAQNNDTNAN